jgi:hypothetical protein
MEPRKTALSILLVFATILTSTTSMPMLNNQPQEAAAQINFELEVLQDNDDCDEFPTICANAFTGMFDLQGDIEGDASIISSQVNACQDGADCSNAKTDTITISAEDTSFIDFFIQQEQSQNNECTGTDTECSKTWEQIL